MRVQHDFTKFKDSALATNMDETTIRICDYCKRENAHTEQENICLARKLLKQHNNDAHALADYIPWSQWHTPQQLSDTYAYSTKHVIRLRKQNPNEIIGILTDRRWAILHCTFTLYLANHTRRPTHR